VYTSAGSVVSAGLKSVGLHHLHVDTEPLSTLNYDIMYKGIYI